MSKHNGMFGGFGLAAVAAAALGLAGCTEYEDPREGTPHVIGVLVGDLNFNEAVPVPNAGECVPGSGEAPYPEPDAARIPPGLCGGITSICPVSCFPPRMGPAYAPLYTGGTSVTYACDTSFGDPRCPAGGSGSYTVSVPSPDPLNGEVYVLTGVRATTYTDDSTPPLDFLFGQIRILFNLLMDPASIEPIPNSGVAASGITVEAGLTGGALADITAASDVTYIPVSPTSSWGATMSVIPPPDGVTGGLTPGWTYRITGDVRDQKGNPLTFLVEVQTAP